MFTKEDPVDSVADESANPDTSNAMFKYTFSNFAFDMTLEKDVEKES